MGTDPAITVTGLVLLGLGVATIYFAVRVVMKTQRAHDERRRYEFENTTEGGVVEYESYDAVKAAQRKSALSSLAGGCAIWVAFGGVLLVLGGWILLKH